MPKRSGNLRLAERGRPVAARSAIRAALYHRVSTIDQNPAAARNDLRDAARRLGACVVLNIEETGSGARNDRPGLLKVLEAARTGRIDAVLVWKLDRFGRSALDLLHQLRELETCGVRFIAVTQAIDVRPGGDPMSRLVVTMLVAFAEFERELIKERTRLGLESARARGVRLGRPRVDVDIDRARELAGEGLSLRKIAERLRVPKTTLDRALRGCPRKGQKSTPQKRRAI